MSITKTLLAGVAGTVLVGSGAMAGEPLKLTETQMDDVTAGFVISTAFISDIIAFGPGQINQTGSVFTEAFEELKVNPTPPVFSIVERGVATANLSASFSGIGGVASPFGTGVCVSNFGCGNGGS